MITIPKRLATAGLAIAVGAGGLLAWSVAAKPADEVVWSDAPAVAAQPAAVPVVEPVAPADAPLSAHGVVQSEQQAVIASRMTALITALPLDAGQSFGRGSLLASFDCSQMRAQAAAASAAASATRTTYDTNVELDRYKAIGTNEVAVARANLGKAAAEAQAIRAGLNQCEIRAPFAGTVVERIAHAHDTAAPGQPLLKIQGAGDLKVELIIPSAWLTWVKPGTPFRFAIDETGGTVEGRVTRLGAAVDPVSRTMRVTGSIAVAGAVLPGMSGTAHFDRS